MIEKLQRYPLYYQSGEFIVGWRTPNDREIVEKINEIIDIINGGKE